MMVDMDIKLPEMKKLSEQEYNCLDTLATARNFLKLMEEDNRRNGHLFDQAIIGPALTMQLRGIRVDQAKVKLADEETCDAAVDLQKEFESIAGKWDWGKSLKPSPDQLRKLLYGPLKVKIRTSQEGIPTVNKEAIASIIEDPRTPESALRIAEINQELAVLEEDRKVLRKPLGETGRFHSSYNVAGTSSGRFNSRLNHFDIGGNVQALSKRLHQIFVPDDGYILVNIDQKQAESKGVAFLSGCKKYKEFHSSGNTHIKVGEILFPELMLDKESAKNTKVPWSKTMVYYDLFKRSQHGANYGQTPRGMAHHIHSTIEEAKKLQIKYFEFFHEIRDWQLEIAQKLRIYHSLTTPLGRTRMFFGRTWDGSLIKEALAYIPQSLISQINKIILWRIWNGFDPDRAQILLEGHDSNLFQIKEGDTETIEEILARARVSVPIRGDVMETEVEANWGYSWGDKDLKEYNVRF